MRCRCLLAELGQNTATKKILTVVFKIVPKQQKISNPQSVGLLVSFPLKIASIVRFVSMRFALLGKISYKTCITHNEDRLSKTVKLPSSDLLFESFFDYWPSKASVLSPVACSGFSNVSLVTNWTYLVNGLVWFPIRGLLYNFAMVGKMQAICQKDYLRHF